MSSTLQRADWLEPRQIGDRRLSLMDHLFNRLDGMYPNRWRASFPGEDSIRNWREAWADALTDAGITPQQVAGGIRTCARRYDWPPSITEFLNACSPPLDYDDAWRVAQAGKSDRDRGGLGCWPTLAVYHAYIRLMRSPHASTIEQTRPPAAWRQLLDGAMRDERDGLLGAIEPPAGQLTWSQPPADKAKAREALRQIGGIAAGMARVSRQDVLEHWHRVLSDPKKPPIAHRFAREALANLGAPVPE